MSLSEELDQASDISRVCSVADCISKLADAERAVRSLKKQTKSDG